MPSYGVAANLIGQSAVYDPFGTTNTNQAGCISYRQGQLSVQNQTNHVYLYHQLASDFSLTGVEKLSTRSSTPATASYLSGVSSPSQPIVVCAMAPYNNSAWSAMPRRIPVCNSIDQLVIAVFIQSDLAQTNRPIMTIEEESMTHPWSRGRMRRTTRPGYWNMFGNSINKITITGGGAFSAIYPVFQFDLMWVDSSGWKNGHIQSNVWNINIFGSKRDERMKVGTGI